MRVAVFRRRPVPHGTWRPFNRFSSAAILFVVTNVFPTTVSAGCLLAKRFLGASAILRQLAVITIHWRCLCSARGNGYIGEDLEDLVRARHPLRGSCADATKRINDWRLLSLLQAKNWPPPGRAPEVCRCGRFATIRPIGIRRHHC